MEKLLEEYFDEVRFLVNLHVTLSNFEPLLQKFKHFITTLINEQLLHRAPLEGCFWILKNWRKFQSGIISKSHVGRQQLY